jgi:hypothetical protein
MVNNTQHSTRADTGVLTYCTTGTVLFLIEERNEIYRDKYRLFMNIFREHRISNLRISSTKITCGSRYYAFCTSSLVLQYEVLNTPEWYNPVPIVSKLQTCRSTEQKFEKSSAHNFDEASLLFHSLDRLPVPPILTSLDQPRREPQTI